ncbi:MAG TPA: YtxH domain-containing protein [Bacillales bacterium]|nr:YtxH domain-containing protein [Bacillales bacterium]
MAARELRENMQNRNDEPKRSNNFLLGALIGGLAGAAVALLFTPKSGKELRNRLIDKTTLTGESLWEKGNEFVKKQKNLSLHTLEDDWDRENINYISLSDREIKPSPTKELDIRKKLDEAKRALEEEEKKVNENNQ